MLNEIRKELINHPEKLKDVLEKFGYCNITIRPTYLSFGRDEYSSAKSIVIRLKNNNYIYVTDYARNINQDLFRYISEQKHVEFVDVLNIIKKSLGISDYYDFFQKRGIFGGFYERIRKRNTSRINVYDDSILDKYQRCANLRFVNDNISIDTQNFFNIRYDVESQGIVIPIYSQLGQLMGAKVRCNYEVEDGENKYYYLIPCQSSKTLYGYFQNYNYLVNNTVYVYESEKSVMQCHSYKKRNCVALGSSSISLKQVQMIFELNPKQIVFMHDTGLKKEIIMRNIDMFRSYSRFSEIEIGYWNYFDKKYPDKCSPSDFGDKELSRIIDEEILYIGDDSDEEEL